MDPWWHLLEDSASSTECQEDVSRHPRQDPSRKRHDEEPGINAEHEHFHVWIAVVEEPIMKESCNHTEREKDRLISKTVFMKTIQREEYYVASCNQYNYDLRCI